jgi:hypothetical protein
MEKFKNRKYLRRIGLTCSTVPLFDYSTIRLFDYSTVKFLIPDRLLPSCGSSVPVTDLQVLHQMVTAQDVPFRFPVIIFV